MRVKPFYISTDWLTEKEVGIAIDKCVKSGANACEGVYAYHGDCDFHGGLMTFNVWRFFGVDKSNETVFEDGHESFGIDAQEITLDQLDEWLGISQTETPEEKEVLDMTDTTSKQVEGLAKGDVVEWDGECLPPVGVECEKIFDGKSQIVTPLYYDDHKSGMVMFYYRNSGKSVDSDYDWCLVENCVFRKPESPKQKAERERLNKIKDSIRWVVEWEINISNNRDWESVSDSVYCAVEGLLKAK